MTADSAENDRVPPRSGHRAFRHVVPSSEETSRARSLPADACPRRYCWWWRTLSFTWQVSVTDGCTFPRDKKPDWWPQPDRPCCRSVPDSPAGHYESRGPMLDEVGTDGSRWLDCKKRREHRTA